MRIRDARYRTVASALWPAICLIENSVESRIATPGLGELRPRPLVPQHATSRTETLSMDRDSGPGNLPRLRRGPGWR
ncbi:MAG: hypothetical protein WAM53_11120, partial [Terrimicrobiaceae bacterium]